MRHNSQLPPGSQKAGTCYACLHTTTTGCPRSAVVVELVRRFCPSARGKEPPDPDETQFLNIRRRKINYLRAVVPGLRVASTTVQSMFWTAECLDTGPTSRSELDHRSYFSRAPLDLGTPEKRSQAPETLHLRRNRRSGTSQRGYVSRSPHHSNGRSRLVELVDSVESVDFRSSLMRKQKNRNQEPKLKITAVL
ncbi:hypothetical protein B0H14DRAFT_2782935 [Mycena olivaceomarginata]|nr:hypothetical protein B0H14DRAFT_2782935 [Mycena olivaceomarginata]